MNLIQASSKGDLAAVKAAIENREDVNAIDIKGRSAIIEASWSGHSEIVQLLIAKKADLNNADISGFTALMRACEEGHIEIVKMLISNNADVNHKGSVRGTTALMLAAEQGYIEIINLLLDHEARINDVDQYEETALARAIKNDQMDVAKHLESRGGRGKPERNSFSYNQKEIKSITKVTLPEWSAGSFETGIDEDLVIDGAEKGFDDDE